MEKFYDKGGKFDHSAWCDDVTMWEKNKEALGFKVKIRIVEGKIQMNIDSEKKYKKAITSLTMKILNGAMQWICLAYNFQVKEEHKESEKARFQKEWSEKLELLLNTFLESGLSGFFDLLDSFKTIFRMQYELDNLTYVDGVWYRWNGDRWNGSNWTDSAGKVYSDAYGVLFKTVLPAEPEEKVA